LFKLAPVVVEINTNDLNEHKLLGQVHAFYNRLTRGIFLGRAAGLVFATRELMEQPEFARYGRPGCVVTNSIDLAATPFYPAPANRQPRLVFIGTPGMAWHGAEKLVPFAAAYPDIAVNVVGLDRLDTPEPLPPNLVLHGYLSGPAYESVLARADAAIGTIALHVKQMEEAATLKVRDCAARGLPCVLPYYDSDFDGLPEGLFLRIPNTTANLQSHGAQVHAFLLAASGKRVPREMIEARISSSVKEDQRLEFFNKILARTG
jgi:hypothetical protein